MAINPAQLMKLMGAKNKFEAAHPKFTAFFENVLRRGLPEGTVLEMTVTYPGGETVTSNMKVTAQDLELFEELKSLGK